MSANFRIWFILWLALPFWMSCTLYPERPAPPALHDFGPFRPAREAFPWARAEVTAPDWMQDPRLHYRLLYAQSTEVRAYRQDSWVAPPAILLAQRLNGGQHSGPFRLRLALQNFEQIFDRPDRSRVVLAFLATVEREDRRGLLAERDFHFALPAPTADAKGALAAFPRLIGQAEEGLREWVQTLRLPAAAGG
jgi:cholesterol transport system auxiliary component